MLIALGWILWCVLLGPLKRKKKVAPSGEVELPRIKPPAYYTQPHAIGVALSPNVHTKDKAPNKQLNYLFYANQVESKPDGALLDTIHREWPYKFSTLELHHGYIQWLFPVFESGGMSFSSEELGHEEARLMRSDLAMAVRLLKSYKMMLQFYGCILVDYSSGRIARHPTIWHRRYRNLVSHPHNYLRISARSLSGARMLSPLTSPPLCALGRIIMSLGQLGFTRYKQALVDHLQEEIHQVLPCGPLLALPRSPLVM